MSRRPPPYAGLAAVVFLLALAACADGATRLGAFPAYQLPAGKVGAVEPIAQPAGRGALVLDGGGYSTRSVLDRIVAHAGPAPTLCLIDTALAGGGDLRRFFRGYPDLRLDALALDRESADDPAMVEALRACSGYYFGGGDPERLSTALRPEGHDSPALAVIRERFEQGGAMVSGSSAGAMIAGPITLCECGQRSSIAALTEGLLFQAPGFDFLSGVLIDAHFFARGLLGRHLYALARNHLRIGVGIDEETAVVVPNGDGAGDGLWEVVGNRAVAVIEAPRAVSTDRLGGFTLSLLSPGDRFDPLRSRFALASDRRPATPDPEGEAGPITIDDIFDPNRVRELLVRLAKSPASEAIGYAARRAIRVTFRKTDDTETYSDGATYSILRVSASIERVAD